MVCAVAAASSGAQELTPQQVGQYMAAAGEVFAAQASMQGIAGTCGEDAARMSGVWNERNAAAVAKAEKLRGSALRQIEKAAGSQAARTLQENQNRSLAEKVAKLVREVEALPPEKKKHLCRRYARTVDQGQWDISRNAGLHQFLMNASLE